MELRSKAASRILGGTSEAGRSLVEAPELPPLSLMQWAEEKRSSMLVWLTRYNMRIGIAMLGLILAVKIGVAALSLYLAPIRPFDKEALVNAVFHQAPCVVMKNKYDKRRQVWKEEKENVECDHAAAFQEIDEKETEHYAAVKARDDGIWSGGKTALILYFVSVILLPVSIARAILTATFALPAAALASAALWCEVEATAIPLVANYATGALVLTALSVAANKWYGPALLHSLLGRDGKQRTVGIGNSKFASPRDVQLSGILKR